MASVSRDQRLKVWHLPSVLAFHGAGPRAQPPPSPPSEWNDLDGAFVLEEDSDTNYCRPWFVVRHNRALVHASFSGDSRYLVVSEISDFMSGGNVVVYDVAQKQLVFAEPGHSYDVFPVWVGDSPHEIVIGSRPAIPVHAPQTQSLAVYCLETREKRQFLLPLKGARHHCLTALCRAPGRVTFATVTGHSAIALSDVSVFSLDSETLHVSLDWEIVREDVGIAGLAALPESDLLVVHYRCEEHSQFSELQVWDTREHTFLRKISPAAATMQSTVNEPFLLYPALVQVPACFADARSTSTCDGRSCPADRVGPLVACGGEDGRTRLWSAVHSGGPLAVVYAHTAVVNAVAAAPHPFSPESRVVLITGSDDRSVCVWA
eukprot:TRINITY_DN2287_c0_g1_i3.p1 TRINITY_DN2287_c0_g1~~TRINITY_DN2287_c0_g1_i3.p1  ORF type:complete len:376 (-),score=75.15 TRINITY_DN2287_c0_g1_i3:41-1168(-)